MSGAAGFWLWHAALALSGAALVAWTAPRLQRGLRLSDGARGFWLGAWMLAALPAPLALAWQAWAPMPVSAALPLLTPLQDLPLSLGVSPASPAAASDFPAGAMLLALYLAGVAFGALRWGRALRALRRVLRTAVPLSPAAWPGPRSRAQAAQLQARGVGLASIAQPMSPFALRWPRPAIMLPRALLARLDDAQLCLVLRHEAAHLARRDPQWALLLRVANLLLWFNPWLRGLARRVQLAAELACDAAALGAEKNMRRAYAEAYLETLRMSMAPALPCPAIAFSPQDQGSHRMRIGHIVHGDPHARKRPLLSLALASLALALGGGWTAVQAASSAAPGGVASDAVAFAGPIIAGRISSPYGVMRPKLGALAHNGVDLTAARGTPVHAPAAGTVQVATEHYATQPSYGTVIVLDHGGGWQSVYAHLDALDVQPGDSVAAGERIGRVGSTGKATGPHVHVELHRDGTRIDPASVIETLVGTR